MPWVWIIPVDGSPRDQPFCSESATFRNESIIREIITGR